MKNASNFLNGFPFELNEKIIVDSFTYISAPNKTTYVGFLTNQRFIFRQTTHLSLSGVEAWQDGLGEADIKYIPLNRLRGIKIKKGRITFNGDIYDTNGKHTATDFGEFGKGFGGLTYSSHAEVYVRILEALSKYGKEYGFYLWAPQNPEFTTADKKQQEQLSNILNSYLKTIGLICGVILTPVVGILGWALLTSSPSDAIALQQQEVAPITQTVEEPINTCTWQERSESISFDCEVVDLGKNVTITNLSNGVVEVFENQYNNDEYVHTENGQYWIRGGQERKSFFANGTAIHF